jgi:hypothetical protein
MWNTAATVLEDTAKAVNDRQQAKEAANSLLAASAAAAANQEKDKDIQEILKVAQEAAILAGTATTDKEEEGEDIDKTVQTDVNEAEGSNDSVQTMSVPPPDETEEAQKEFQRESNSRTDVEDYEIPQDAMDSMKDDGEPSRDAEEE